MKGLLTVIENVHVYEPKDLGTSDILLCHEKIVEIGPNLVRLFPKARLIDGEGLLAIPGYMDQHVHVTGGGGEGGFATRVPELQLSDCVRAGVTTLVGLLGTDGITRSIENLLAKTKALNEEGITAYCLTGSYGYPTLTLTGDVKKDIAFIQEILGVKIAVSDHRSSHLTKQELVRLVSDVRMAALISGKPGLVVFHLGRGKEQLDMIFDIISETELPIKHFRPTHVQKVQEQAVKFAKMGGYIDFTASSDSRRSAASIIDALKAGAPLDRITISTDSNGSSPRWNENNEMIGITAASMDSLHNVIRFLIQEQQMSVTDAISLVTTNVAHALELNETKGRLHPGYDADILLLDKGLKIDTVIARGRLLMQSGEVKVKGTFEE